MKNKIMLLFRPLLIYIDFVQMTGVTKEASVSKI